MLKTLRIDRLNWDSDFFGLEVGRIHASADIDEQTLKEFIIESNLDLIYHSSEKHSPVSIAEPPYKSVFVGDQRLYCTELSNRNNDERLSSPKIQNWIGKGLSPQILQLAIEAGALSRYRIDPYFGEEQCDRLYEQWIINSLSGEFAEAVFVYLDEADLPSALATLQIKNLRAQIGLISVDERMRGKGIATALIEHVMEFASKRKCTELLVSTQADNRAACNLYEKNGFTIKSQEAFSHIWKQRGVSTCEE